ncbi:TetR/AcrR family transcriptional regulator [Halococcus agarilyticus]|uniref:TetR/AcrR family transcriptional regulator n=1 Tax=Halococcus agarilyticus TaxID=1232219 RepID=UPI000677D71C|nr:TetR/AcrR family transcriptional regulator [Halococcus agarilyticus]
MTTDAADQTGTQTAIMEATYRALCEHGYADLTIQAIADEFAKSKSLLYYHYDTKDEILVAFLEYVLDQFTVEEAVDTADAPDDQLRTLVDNFVPESPTTEQREFQVALFELRSRALSDEAYREQFSRADRLVRDTLVDVLTAGVDDDIFRDVDVERTADHLVSAIDGAMLRRASTTDDATKTREALLAFVDSHLLAND